MFLHSGSIDSIVFQWSWHSTSTVGRMQHESASFFGCNFQERNAIIRKQSQTCTYSNPRSKLTRS
jgi:hypothetical protein